MKTLNIEKADLIDSVTWWQKKGLSFTRSGYGSKIPTAWKVRHNKRLKRVYCIVWSNTGSLFIMSGKNRIFLEVY